MCPIRFKTKYNCYHIDIDDVNNALKEINDALSDKITEADLQNILKDQATINETLCT